MIQWRTDTGEVFDAHVTVDGRARLLARLAPDRSRPRMGKSWAASMPIVPRSDWYEVDYSGFGVPILNQGAFGSCTGHGTCTTVMLARAVAGAQFQLLSPTFIYAQVNGGRDQGAVGSDAVAAAQSVGVCLMSENGENQIYKSRIPSSAFTTAKRFAISDWYHASSFDEIVSGLLYGYMPSYGFYVGGDIDNLDADGCPPAHNAMGNHWVCGDGLKKSSKWGWVIPGPNSWGTSWGNHGRFAMNEQLLYNRANDADACLVKFTVIDPQDTNDPPPVTG